MNQELNTIPRGRYVGALAMALWCVAGVPVASGQGMHLARYGAASADSLAAGTTLTPERAVDGIVGDTSRWVSGDGPGPHWLEVTLPGPFPVGRAHVFSGVAGRDALAAFHLAYWDGGAWQPIPGTRVRDNTETQRRIRFAEPVTTDRIRLVTHLDGPVTVAELAVFPAGRGAHRPIDSGVELDVAMTPTVTASSQLDATTRPFLATDGIVASDSVWVSGPEPTPHWLELEFNLPRTIGSAHLYGVSAGRKVSYPARFHLEQRAEDGDWEAIRGAEGRGSSSGAVRLDFPPVTAGAVRVVVEGEGVVTLREIVLLPPNLGAGYPAGTAVRLDPPPPADFDTYADNLYALVNLDAGRRVQVGNSRNYHLLNLYGTPYYRIVSRDAARCLEVTGASREPGAPVREGVYRALDYQLWEVHGPEGRHTIHNVHSGLELALQDGSLCQQPPGTNSARFWDFVFQSHFPRKGMADMGTGRKMTDQRISQYYNWGRVATGGMPDDIHHHPMQWGNREWEQFALERPVWAATARPVFLLGFNEPDRPDQSRMPPEQVVRLWSKFEAVALPLVSPAPSWWNNSWTTRFFDLAWARGLRYDRVGIHVYITGRPDADGFMDICRNSAERYGRPVWNTEWNVVNWGGPATWTAEEEYTWMAEVLHRMEFAPFVDSYHFFPFSPAWPNGAPGALWSDGITMTPLGRLYGSWDRDAELRTATWYYLHNKGTHRRLAAAGGDVTPSLAVVDNMRPHTQWLLRDAGDDLFQIVARDGDGRLTSDGNALAVGPPDTDSEAVRWRFRPHEHGWYFLENAAGDARLQAAGEALSLVTSGSEDGNDSLLWRPIKPYNPGAPVEGPDTVPPGPPHDLQIVEGYNVLRVSWKDAGAPSDLAGYRLFRAAGKDGPFEQLAGNLAVTSYTDTGAENGRRYRYRVVAFDDAGNESVASPVVEGMPANWTKVDDMSPRVEYGGRWGTYSGNPGYMATEHYTETEGATATFTFDGTHIRFYGYRRLDLGIIDVLLDGELMKTVDAFGVTPEFQALLFEARDLKSGTHTITIRNTGRQNPYSAGNEIIVDGFEYLQPGEDTSPPGVPAQVVAKPGGRRISLSWKPNTEADFVGYTLLRREGDEGWQVLTEGLAESSYDDGGLVDGRAYAYAVRAVDTSGNRSAPSSEVTAVPGLRIKLDDRDPAFAYSEGWGTYNGNPGFKGTEHYSENKGASVTVTWSGTSIRLYGHRRDDLGIAEVAIDGEPVGEIDGFWQTSSYGDQLFESEDLPPGEHTLTVTVTGRQNARSSGFEIIVDAAEFTAADGEE